MNDADRTTEGARNAPPQGRRGPTDLPEPVATDHLGTHLAPRTPTRLPSDAQRMGLMTETAPELEFVSALRADRPLHKAIAWVLLVGLVGMFVLGLILSI